MVTAVQIPHARSANHKPTIDKLTLINETISQLNSSENIVTLFQQNAYQINDIVKLGLDCHWEGGFESVDCTESHFTTTVTNYGNCFTFNPYTEPNKKLVAIHSGSASGLRVTIDTQQDEYSGKWMKFIF